MMIVRYIFVSLMMTIGLLGFLFGIVAIFWGARLYYHIFKHYPEKLRKYLFGFRINKLLDEEKDVDEIFVYLTKRFKYFQNLVTGAVLINVALMLLYVLITIFQ